MLVDAPVAIAVPRSRLAPPRLPADPSTVHSHTKAIYRKLGVSSRHEAVERASEITLR
jgi:hypothetical protein